MILSQVNINTGGTDPFNQAYVEHQRLVLEEEQRPHQIEYILNEKIGKKQEQRQVEDHPDVSNNDQYLYSTISSQFKILNEVLLISIELFQDDRDIWLNDFSDVEICLSSVVQFCAEKCVVMKVSDSPIEFKIKLVPGYEEHVPEEYELRMKVLRYIRKKFVFGNEKSLCSGTAVSSDTINLQCELDGLYSVVLSEKSDFVLEQLFEIEFVQKKAIFTFKMLTEASFEYLPESLYVSIFTKSKKVTSLSIKLSTYLYFDRFFEGHYKDPRGYKTEYYNIIFFGEKGSGKSSLINSIASSTSNTIRNNVYAADSADHVTEKFTPVDLSTSNGFNYAIKLWDIWGWDDGNAITTSNFSNILEGLLKPMSTKDNQTLVEQDDKKYPIHAVVFVINIKDAYRNSNRMEVHKKFLNALIRKKNYSPIIALSFADVLDLNGIDRAVENAKDYLGIKSVFPISSYETYLKKNFNAEKPASVLLFNSVLSAIHFLENKEGPYSEIPSPSHVSEKMVLAVLIVLISFGMYLFQMYGQPDTNEEQENLEPNNANDAPRIQLIKYLAL